MEDNHFSYHLIISFEVISMFDLTQKLSVVSSIDGFMTVQKIYSLSIQNKGKESENSYQKLKIS